MRASQLWAIVAPAILLLSQQLSTPVAAHADTYQLVGLGIDNVSFYNLSTSGQTVFSTYNCSGPGPCYGNTGNWSSIAPTLSSDSGSACSPSLPAGTSNKASVCNDGRTAYYGFETGSYGVEGLYSFLDADSPQLIYTGFLTGSIYMNGIGDIVFDDGNLDEWYEAVNLTPSPTPALFTEAASATTPEPATFLLLATGILGGMFFLRRRRNAPATL